jgi:Cu(I)/Ag(I) efflux system membrane fusion protein
MNSIEGKVMTNHENHSTMKKEISKNTNELSFGVRGNCTMCKATIETAANSVPGVFSANWSVEKKKIDVVFNTSKTTELEIHKAIASAGYDTEKVKGNTSAYDNLPTCCLYSRDMEMNQ